MLQLILGFTFGVLAASLVVWMRNSASPLSPIAVADTAEPGPSTVLAVQIASEHASTQQAEAKREREEHDRHVARLRRAVSLEPATPELVAA
jgi:hypothetical protein